MSGTSTIVIVLLSVLVDVQLGQDIIKVNYTKDSPSQGRIFFKTCFMTARLSPLYQLQQRTQRQRWGTGYRELRPSGMFSLAGLA